MPRRRNRGSSAGIVISPAAWVALVVGATNPFTVRLVGLMPVSEIVLLAAGALVLLQVTFSHRLPGKFFRERTFQVLLACQAVALCGYIVSDIWRGSTPGDISRGWARMVFLAFDVACMAVLFERVQTFVFYQVGVVLSGVHVFVHGALFDDPWKFGYGVPLTVLGLLMFPLGGPWLAGLGALGMAAVHWGMDFRSMALICVLLAVMQCSVLLPRTGRRLLFFVGLALVLVLGAFKGQITGEGSERSKRSDAERTAMLSAASEGFLSSPLIGQGSWFSRSNVMFRFVEIRAENAKEAGVGGFADDDGDTMAIHSQLLVCLAEGGLFGGAFFIAYGAFLVWGIYYLAVLRPWDRQTAVFLFVVLSGLLNVLFTPFSGSARVDIAATVGLLLYLRHESNAAPRPVKGGRVRWTSR